MFFSKKKKNWTKVADDINDLAFGDNNIVLLDLPERPICIGRNGNRFIAFAHRCPHAGAPMQHGYLDSKGQIICIQHGLKFSCKNGLDRDDQAYRLPVWEVDVRAEGVFVALD